MTTYQEISGAMGGEQLLSLLTNQLGANPRHTCRIYTRVRYDNLLEWVCELHNRESAETNWAVGVDTTMHGAIAAALRIRHGSDDNPYHPAPGYNYPLRHTPTTPPTQEEACESC